MRQAVSIMQTIPDIGPVRHTICARMSTTVHRSPTLHRLRVLLVQPERDDREMYTEYFLYHRLSPMSVPDATHALRVAASADVILTELLLPGRIDGFELIARLKHDDRTAHIPIAVLTACAWAAERDRAAAAGCDAFLSKPCLPHEVLRAVRKLLPRSRAQKPRALNAG